MNFKRIADVCLLVIFCVLVILPMTKLSKAEKSEKENRMLAKYEPMFIDGKFNPSYFHKFSSYFNDRFYMRNELIRFYSSIVDQYSMYGNDRVLKGEDGWLFGKDRNALDNFQNKILFTEYELENITKYLSDINNWAKKNGKTFYFVIVPDKNKIYGEYISILTKIRGDSESRTNQLIRYLKNNTDVDVLYLYDVLKANKHKGLLYYKEDSHWNDYGAYIGYTEIINNISKKFSSVKPISFLNLLLTRDSCHGLSYSILHNQHDTTMYLMPEIIQSQHMYGGETKYCRDTFFCTNQKKNLNVTIFRDSFTNGMVRYFCNTFNYVKYVKYDWTYKITADDLIEMSENHTDIIILEIVERNLPMLVNLEFPEGV